MFWEEAKLLAKENKRKFFFKYSNWEGRLQQRGIRKFLISNTQI
jgi:hypothetical protein